jgi:3-methylcrotonyl-CoA carboxylase alpha subunit
MRVAGTADAVSDALAAARREAVAAFGDGTLLLERLLTDVRHIEVQVLGDHHGAVVHFGERDCSVQRRHQKVVEESPAPGLSAAVRAALGDAALRIARAAGYTNAGTCEFLVDGAGQFWFIEMNARLQVEHPVTEAVTGIDLVRAQLAIAAGRPLPWRQDEIVQRGHAIECRLYAEDPERGDIPTTGRLARFHPPVGPGLRHDVGYGDGDDVPPFYDTMLGKLIAAGPDRDTAIRRARAALDAYAIVGLPTNRRLLATILEHPAFVAGGATTDLLAAIAGTPGPAHPHTPAPPEVLAAAVAWDVASSSRTEAVGGSSSGSWAIAGQGIVGFWLADPDGEPQAVTASREDRHAWRVGVAGETFLVTVADARSGDVLVRPAAPPEPDVVPGWPRRYRLARTERDITTLVAGRAFSVRCAPPPSADARPGAGVTTGASSIIAPLPGRVVAVLVAAGDRVAERQPVVIIEAMKIESTLAAPRAGTIQAVHARPGDAVAAGHLLVELAVP